jgi:hypothetical protein
MKDPNELRRIRSWAETQPNSDIYYLCRYLKWIEELEDSTVIEAATEYAVDWVKELQTNASNDRHLLATILRSI